MGFKAKYPGSKIFWDAVDAYKKSVDGSLSNGEKKFPELTFGLEMEFAFYVQNQLYDKWISTAVGGIDYLIASDAEVELYEYARDALKADKELQERRRAEILAEGEGSSELSFADILLPSPTSSTSSKDTDATSSDHPQGRSKLIGYLTWYLNQRNKRSKTRAARRGTIEITNPKTGNTNVWNLMTDDSVMPQRKALRKVLQISKLAAHKEFRVVGAELVSSVLEFDDEHDWAAKLRQLRIDLNFNGSDDRGTWLYDLTHLHVHFGIKDTGIPVQIAKNVAVLYGLFEAEISSWLPKSQRDNSYCQPVRKGMDKERLQYVYDANNRNRIVDVELLPGKRFTPREFAQRILDTRDLAELKTEISGWSAGEWVREGLGLAFASDEACPGVLKDAYPLKLREWVTVNISMARDNKPTTIEFRQHHGTMDPETISWWVKFLGSLIQLAHQLAKQGIGSISLGRDPKESWVDQLVLSKMSILDIIAFPSAGKAHFEKMRVANFDTEFETKKNADFDLVAERIRRRRQGQRTGTEMDNDILDNKVPLPIARGEEHPRPVALRGQDLVDRLLRIVRDLKYSHNDGDVSQRNRNLFLSRMEILEGHEGERESGRGDGFDMNSRKGMKAILEVVRDYFAGIGLVWFDAYIIVCTLKYSRMSANGTAPAKVSALDEFLILEGAKVLGAA